jgi:ectoine hydroxylase-related dioxygenase (phytanoyl-CoA dioxygenase family)
VSATSAVFGRDVETGVRDVRAVTELELSYFRENGWVLLRRLISAELSEAMLERGRPRLAGLMGGSDVKFASPEERNEHLRVAGTDEGSVTDNDKWVEWRGAIRSAHDSVLGRAALAKTMGLNVQRLLGRDQPIRVYHDIFMCKLPDRISTRTEWHQDSVSFPLDRNVLTVWIALEEITPEQGPVQFYSGSHRCGMLGRGSPDRSSDLVDQYPELARYAVSPANHLQPGDATVHHGLTVHGAGANNTRRPRWSFAVCYLPADARYTGAPNHDCDGFGLRIGYPIDHPSFTLVAT